MRPRRRLQILLLVGAVGALGIASFRFHPTAEHRREVITVFVEDPWRIHDALRLWRLRPGSLLVMQGRPSSLEQTVHHLRSRDLWPLTGGPQMVLTAGCDTVGQIRALSEALGPMNPPGRVTIVTSDTHLSRSLAIGHILLGSQGWKVEGYPVVGHDSRPELPWRRYRDVLRSYLWRAIGWDGGLPDRACP